MKLCTNKVFMFLSWKQFQVYSPEALAGAVTHLVRTRETQLLTARGLWSGVCLGPEPVRLTAP